MAELRRYFFKKMISYDYMAKDYISKGLASKPLEIHFTKHYSRKRPIEKLTIAYISIS